MTRQDQPTLPTIEDPSVRKPRSRGKKSITRGNLFSYVRRELTVEQAHIDEAMPKDSHSCMIAEAIKAGIPEAIPTEMCYLGWQESLAQLATLVEPDIPG